MIKDSFLLQIRGKIVVFFDLNFYICAGLVANATN